MGILVLGGMASLASARRAVASTVIGSASAALACAVGLAGTIIALCSGEQTLNIAWNPDWGCSFHLGVDPLSGFFLLPILVLGLVAAVYGAQYTLRETPTRPASWFYFNLMLMGMTLVCLARNGMLFLIAWEVMSLASYFLVMHHSQRQDVRRGGWVYLVATHIGTTFLLVLFVLLSRSGSFEFSTFSQFAATGGHIGTAFMLAVIGFGVKAGFVPLHVWQPEAYPAAPAHVSAVMSGVMSKTGIYGLLRIITFLGMPPIWWGWTLVGIGVASGLLGIVMSLTQHNLKKSLAYSSVENLGIVSIGIGMGLIGWSTNQPMVAALGLAGGLMHVINHATFKGLLFMGSGAIEQATGTLQMDQLGGLAKKMPQTAGAFLIGSAAICGLPPLNGFASELTIYLSSFKAVSCLGMGATTPAILIIGSLALIGGLAAASFTRLFGATFLGEPRTGLVAGAQEASPMMRWPMLVLAGGCVVIGLTAPLILRAMGPVVLSIMTPAATLAGAASHKDAIDAGLASGSSTLWRFTLAGGVFFAVLGGLVWLRRSLLKGRSMEQTGTWDCGYIKPTAKMQYTASSFADPIVAMFAMLLRTVRIVQKPEGLFPKVARASTDTPDLFTSKVYDPAFFSIGWLMSRLRWLQQGRIQLYVLYIALTLLILLLWKLG